MTAYAGEDVEQEEPSSIAGRSTNLYSHIKNTCNSSSEIENQPNLKPRYITLGHIHKEYLT